MAVSSHDLTPIEHGWRVAATKPGDLADPSALARAITRGELETREARVPGTAAEAFPDADVDQQDWWFYTAFEAAPPGPGEETVLSLDGLATIAEVYLNGTLVLESESMFAAHRLNVGSVLRGENELAICCRALAPLLARPRRPRARWRTRMVAGNLRFYRTMLLGRAPGFAPGPAVAGPWRPVRLERHRDLAVEELTVRAGLDGTDGMLWVRAQVRSMAGASPISDAALECRGNAGATAARLSIRRHADDRVTVEGRLRVPDAELWWPHTHGRPSLYEAVLLLTLGGRQVTVGAGGVGFRSIAGGDELEQRGLMLRVNGVPIFARGAVWTPLHGALRSPARGELRRVLEAAAAAGMNMLRIPGTATYESPEFHSLCDELGILVWQDLMFANLDYPESDERFMATIEREIGEVLGPLGAHPSLAVVCGSSEVAQQVAMMGLDPALAAGPLHGELVPSVVAAARLDAVYVPSAPWGGHLPFRTDRGVASYFGVGGYRRGLEDARRAEVKFAAECLAFSNVPDDHALASFADGEAVIHHPRWKAGVPRDAGAGWDFEDVRDHYLALSYGVDARELRYVDNERYLELSRAVTGEVMAEVLGEWRRGGSPCNGALILWLTDLLPGAGWGVLDHRGQPKAAYHHLRRALAAVAVWSTDEGLNGVAAHIANDGPEPLRARLRVALYSDLEVPVGEARAELALEPHQTVSHDVEALLGRFVDLSWAYRFGPPAQDLIVLSLERDGPQGTELLAQSFRLPAGRPLAREPAQRLGFTVDGSVQADGAIRLALRSDHYAHHVRVRLPGYSLADDAFSLEPAHTRILHAAPTAVASDPVAAAGAAIAAGVATSVSMYGHVRIEAR